MGGLFIIAGAFSLVMYVIGSVLSKLPFLGFMSIFANWWMLPLGASLIVFEITKRMSVTLIAGLFIIVVMWFGGMI